MPLSDQRFLQDYWEEIINKFPCLELPTSPDRSIYSSSPVDLSEIYDQISASDNAIGFLDAEIFALEDCVSKLQSHLQKVRSYKVYQQSLLSPTRKLPNELLAHIFSFVFDEYVNLAGDPSDDFWGIQLVCVRWRSIVHSTSSLWTKFSIVDPQSTVRTMTHVTRGIAPRLPLFLKNSGTAPLAISLLPGPYMQFQISLIKDIANHCDRWESFDVDMEILPMAVRDTDITDTVKNKGLPILRRVAIDNQSFPKAEIISPFTLFVGAVKLEYLYLQSTNFPDIGDFSWSNLRKLVVTECHINSEGVLYSALRLMPLLEELGWGGNRVATGHSVPEPPTILLSSLHTLNVGVALWDRPYFDGVKPPHLPNICIPRLTNLNIMEDIEEFPSLLTIIRISDFDLKCLVLDTTSTDFMLSIIKELNSIKDLTLLNQYDALYIVLEKLMWRREYSPNHTNLLPSLQTLVLHLSDVDRNYDYTDSLINVMHARSSVSTASVHKEIVPLTHIKIATYRNVGNIGRLESFGKEMGIKVEYEFIS